jgi:regulator of sigma E protease
MEALATLGHFLLTVLIGLVVLTVLVYVHELGHYLFAKACGMRVNAFAIFMGGVRKTGLAQWLEKPQAPVGVLWSVFAVSFLAAVAGALLRVDALYLAGLAGAGVAVPVWAMVRMAALYHVPPAQVLVTWLKALAIGAIVLLIGTRLRGVDANMVLGVATGATLIALALVYYIPVQMRELDDDQQGHGQIEVVGKDGTKHRVPVRYRPVWSRIGKDGTEFSLLLLPLGGFAAIAGMHAKPDGSETRVAGGFYSRPPWQRLLVLFAGPLFSVLFGVVVLWGLYVTVGKNVADNRPILFTVGKGSAAEKAGLKSGDEVVAIDGKPVATFYDLVQLVRDNWREVDGKREPIPMTVTYRRDGETATVTAVPEVDKEPGLTFGPDLEPLPDREVHARLGVGFGVKKQRYAAGPALSQAVNEPVKMIVSLAQMPFKPSRAADNVGGPTVMAQVTSAAVREGAEEVAWVAAILSISLGVMNLLPIVPLDGGQMVVAFIEMLRGGRRLSINVQNWLANSGIALIALLMLAVWAVDLGRNAEANQRAAEEAPKDQPK